MDDDHRRKVDVFLRVKFVNFLPEAVEEVDVHRVHSCSVRD